MSKQDPDKKMDTTMRLGRRPDSAGFRDSVHLPGISVTAGEILEPGTRVLLRHGLAWKWEAGAFDERTGMDLMYVGIVDPFLEGKVLRGNLFWLCVPPGSINSLNHAWTHSSIPNDTKELEDGFLQTDAERRLHGGEAREFLRQIAEEGGVDLDEMIAHALDGGQHDSYVTFNNDGANRDMTHTQEFWDAIEVVTGQKLSEEHRHNTYFGCSC